MTPKQWKENARREIEALLSDGETVIAVYENHDLGHPLVGRRIVWPFSRNQGDLLKLGSQAPDGSYGLGWRWRLIEKTENLDRAVALFCDDAEAKKEGD